MAKISESKRRLFQTEKKKLIKLQPDSSKHRERTQSNKIRNEKGEVTIDITEIQTLMRTV